MGLSIDTTLDFPELTTHPTAPSGKSSLWVYEDGQLYLTNAGSSGKVMTDANRPPAIWFTTETGTPLVPTNSSSPLYGYDVILNDLIVRKDDTEVFQYQTVPGPGSPSFVVTDLGFSMASGVPTAARMHLDTATAVAAATTVVVPFDTVDFDPGSNITIASHEFKCPVPGYYQVSTAIYLDVSVAAAYSEFEILILQNALTVSAFPFEYAQEGIVGASCADILQCAADDTITLGVYSHQVGTLPAQAPPNKEYNYLSIVKVN